MDAVHGMGRGRTLKVVLSVDPVKYPLTGIGRYTYELGRGLEREGLASLQFLRGYQLTAAMPSLNDASPMAAVPAWKGWAQQSRMAVAAYRRLSPWLKARALRGCEDHVFHGPNYYLPPFGGRSVVTIHDLSPYVWPQSHPPERVRYMRAEIELSLQRAAAIITDTQYTRHEVASHFGWPLERVFAVPLANGPEFCPRQPEVLAPVLAAMGLQPGGYVLFTGTVEPRKNLSTLLSAYRSLPPGLRQRWPLVIAGYRGWASSDLHQSMQSAQEQGWLKYLGFVPHATLPLLMAGAHLFVYPSHYEGFGLPVLEAMASGVPVVCSNASSLPEVAGLAAAYHHPEDGDTLRALIEAGLQDTAWRARARAAGMAQAAQFSWGKCTRETMAVYQAVASAG